MWLLLLISGLISISVFHPVHVSVSNVDLFPDQGEIQMSFKIFSDDFENIIKQKYGVQLEITKQVNPGIDTSVVNRYISESFSLSVNGTEIDKLKYVKTQLNEEAIWLFYEYEHTGKIESIKIINSVMMDMFEDQINLVIITCHDKQNGYRLDNKNRIISFKI